MTADGTEHQPRHLAGTEDAEPVETTYVQQVEAGIDAMFSVGGILLTEGRPGLGKSFAVDLAAARLGLPTYWVDMPHRPKGNETLIRVYRAITGSPPPPRIRHWALTDDVVNLLEGEPCVLVVDESQNVDRESLRVLRYVHDRRTTRFVLVLVGVDLRRHLSAVPELMSRVGRVVLAHEFTARQAASILSSYHPIFAATDAAVIAELWGWARGNFRNWAHVLFTAKSLRLGSPGLTAGDASLIYRAINGSLRREPA